MGMEENPKGDGKRITHAVGGKQKTACVWEEKVWR